MRLYTAAASLIFLILVPFLASALGLGDISLNSALNEPFSAEIPLESVQPSDLDELTVELASADTFDRYGLDRPAFLSDFRFAVAENQNGKPVLSLSSRTPVAEPFVTMLLDVRWSSGRLLREYTVLLDPPLFEANVVQPATTPAQTTAAVPSGSEGQVDRSVEPVAEVAVIETTGLFQSEPAASPSASAAEDEAPAYDVSAESESAVEPEVAESEPVVTESTPVSEVQPAPAEPAYIAPVRNTPYQNVQPSDTAPDSYTTERGDTLWRISERVRDGSGLSNNQMMLALYRANPDAFMGNINRLKAGAILRIPAGAELEAPDVAEANSEVIEQHAAWSGSRAPESRLQLVAPAETEDSASSTEADTSADAGATEESGQGAGTDESVGAGDLDGQVAEDQDQRLIDIEDAEMQALQDRIEAQDQAAVESEVEEQIFADTDATADADTDIADDSAADTAAAPGSVGAAPAAEGSFLGGIFSSLWFWGGLALVLLLAVVLARSRKSESEDENDPAATGSWAADIAEPEHDETVRDFGELDGVADPIVVEEDEVPAMFADDPDATHANLSPSDIGISDAEQDSGDSEIEAPFAESFDTPAADDVLGDDLDFRVDADDIFADPEAQEGSVPLQEAAGQDEVELPLEKTISTGAPLNLDQADPIAEAEFHMAYGLYDQAADLLVRALDDAPENRLYRVKLIEVYFVWENKEGFLEQAQALRGSIADESDSDWNKVLILGKQLCPDDDLFSGSNALAPSADSMDLELSDVGETEIDFTLGGNEVQALDLELGSDADDDSGSDGGLDFDFGDESGGAEESVELTLNLGDVDSDATMESPTMESPTVESPGADLGVDLDFGDSDGESTMESPTIENPRMDSETELSDNDATMESGTLESSMDGATLESPTLDTFGSTVETTETSGLEDPTSLEVDLSGLTDLPLDSGELTDVGDSDAFGDVIDIGTEAEDAPAVQDDESEPVFGDDESRISPETENIRVSEEDAAIFADSEELGNVAGDTDIDDEVDGPSDTVEQPSVDAIGGDTAEQPVLDELSDTSVADESSESAESWSLSEDATMTEVGTKLDLARAYIDMGDPDGARSILNEVLDEGEDTQQQEARQLLAELDD